MIDPSLRERAEELTEEWLARRHIRTGPRAKMARAIVDTAIRTGRPITRDLVDAVGREVLRICLGG